MDPYLLLTVRTMRKAFESAKSETSNSTEVQRFLGLISYTLADRNLDEIAIFVTT